MRIEIPELAVVALMGVSGSGKSTFARRHFKPTEVLSSDYFRALVSDDENDQSVTDKAFEALYFVANQRLSLGKLTVIDATNVQRVARDGVLNLAKEQDCFAVAIVLDTPERVCQQRNADRPDRDFGPHVIARQAEQFRRSVKNLRKEGFRYVYHLTPDDIESVEIVRTRSWNDRRDETGPFDIIGDTHGCIDELRTLLRELGYTVEGNTVTPPPGRRVVFVGDLVDRGPGNVDVLRLVMGMVRSGDAFCLMGNHDDKLLRKLKGRDVTVSHGLDITLAELAAEPAEFTAEVEKFLGSLIGHYVFDNGKLVIAHAGCKESYQGRASARVRAFCLYGDTTGETDEYGLPVRLPWARDYRGSALVVYGHTPVPEVETINNTVCIDTGCVFGGKLTAYRYPEREIVQVPAAREYCAPIRPILPAEPVRDDTLAITDVTGKRRLTTRLRQSITVEPENAAAALEVMSRFAADPRWLIYLPPTMSPCETSKRPDYLEHPEDAFAYYRSRGVEKVVCEEKHMGSRAVVVVCRGAETAGRRFGVTDGSTGIIHTRTGRHFFDDRATEEALLARVRVVLDEAGFWEEFATDWVALDCELMPWSAKAGELLIEQYAPVARAGRTGLAAAASAIRRGLARTDVDEAGAAELAGLLERTEAREAALESYAKAYGRYCWEVRTLDDYRLAPFVILATEGRTYTDRTHLWHLETITRLTRCDSGDGTLLSHPTASCVVDVNDEASVAAGITWWTELTTAGGEGMVVKPWDVVAMRGTELLQPGVKCRGPEYLRIIYGPEYSLGGNLDRLRARALGRKRALALTEFALGVESLERFVNHEPLYRVHEAVFAVLAMESQPVDPRL